MAEILSNISLSGLAILASLAGTWYVTQWRLARYDKDREKDKDEEEEEIKKILVQLEKMWEWKDRHEKETTERRIEVLSNFSAHKSEAYHHYSENKDNLGHLNVEVDKLRDWKHKFSSDIEAKFSDMADEIRDLKIEIINRLATIEKKIDSLF